MSFILDYDVNARLTQGQDFCLFSKKGSLTNLAEAGEKMACKASGAF